MKLIENGNFSEWFRVAMFLGGAGIATGGLAFDVFPNSIRVVAFLLGFAFMALGGLSTNAHMLGIRPFDDSYQKARRSYLISDDSGRADG
ncbi:hypothetical protein AB1286_05315 [Trinickia sp. NRRL B-1857]|uniref:hypothetical protein n=1 Tax=Trinickia sp. NRRL B-1857 TaxID=3162879 RepID=UPI003D29D705